MIAGALSSIVADITHVYCAENFAFGRGVVCLGPGLSAIEPELRSGRSSSLHFRPVPSTVVKAAAEQD